MDAEMGHGGVGMDDGNAGMDADMDHGDSGMDGEMDDKL